MSEIFPERYTLEEAERLLKQRECRYNGHDFDVLTVFAAGDPAHVFCRRCGRTWTIE